MDGFLGLFENLTLVAVIAIIIWLVVIGGYIYISRQQRDIDKDVEALHVLLQDEDEE